MSIAVFWVERSSRVRILRVFWRNWQLEVLRVRFPEWDIERTGHDVWHVRRLPVNRVVVGEAETVRGELEWFEKLFKNGIVPVRRLRSLAGSTTGNRKVEDE